MRGWRADRWWRSGSCNLLVGQGLGDPPNKNPQKVAKGLAVWPMIGYRYPNIDSERNCGPYEALADQQLWLS
jgi:hypothetical protein